MENQIRHDFFIFLAYLESSGLELAGIVMKEQIKAEDRELFSYERNMTNTTYKRDTVLYRSKNFFYYLEKLTMEEMNNDKLKNLFKLKENLKELQKINMNFDFAKYMN